LSFSGLIEKLKLQGHLDLYLWGQFVSKIGNYNKYENWLGKKYWIIARSMQ
jgi:hypothetical protein